VRTIVDLLNIVAFPVRQALSTVARFPRGFEIPFDDRTHSRSLWHSCWSGVPRWGNSAGLSFREKRDISAIRDAGAPCRGAMMLDRSITN
jgi:hypothetical protein